MQRVRLDRSMILVVLALASSGCDNRYNALIDGDYLCVATVTSTTCGPDLPDSESVVSVTAGANLSTDPLGLPSPRSEHQPRQQHSVRPTGRRLHVSQRRVSRLRGRSRL